MAAGAILVCRGQGQPGDLGCGRRIPNLDPALIEEFGDDRLHFGNRDGKLIGARETKNALTRRTCPRTH